MIRLALLFFSSALLSVFLTHPVLWIVNFFKLGQAIREEGPAAHQVKAGTPTLGGIGFILAIIIFSMIFINLEMVPKYLALLFLIIGFALIGLFDDLIKILKKQNLGLTFRQKIISQTLVAVLFSYFLINNGHTQTVGHILKTLGFSYPFFYLLLSAFIIVGTANATNLTDGLNGLLAGTAGIAFICFIFLSTRLSIIEAAIFSCIAAGAMVAFLYFNFPKARMFMGDVGSLAIGAALAGIAIILHKELRLILIGGVFLIEALSVILQVTSFKLFKKRIFKMSPLHHHFELMGVKEWQVVVGFWIMGAILGIIGVML